MISSHSNHDHSVMLVTKASCVAGDMMFLVSAMVSGVGPVSQVEALRLQSLATVFCGET